MSSLARSRSLRKPNAPTQPTTATTGPSDADRHASPSRLPTRPHTRTTSSATTTSGAKPTRPLVRSASTRQPVVEQQTKSRYPPSTTTTRPTPTTTTRPTSSGGGASARRAAPTAGHTRAKSTTTTSATNLSSNTVLRPPSQGTTTRTAHARNVSTDRAVKPTTRSASREGASKPPTQTATRTQATSQTTSRAQPKLRPQFSTLQQHYSPAKSRDPKPLTATYLAPPSPSKLPANVQASAETSKLQAELLQLHLLHRDAAKVDAQWRASAKEKLGERFAKLGDAADKVAEKEKEGLERENVLALRKWANEGGLDSKIQGLDTVMNGLWTLTERGGRYARVVRRFERWMDQIFEIEQSRKDGTYFTQDDQSLFVGEIDTAWKEDCSEIIRRLDGWRRQLREIGEPDEDSDTEKSSLTRMLQGSRTLIHDMLAELNLMEEIETEALTREDAWIEKMNRENDDDTPKAGALWRVI